MRITPLRRVTRTNIVAANKSDRAVYHQDFAVIASITAQIEGLAEPGKERIAQHVDNGLKLLEMTRHHQVGKAIKHHIDSYPTLGGMLELKLELLTNAIVFPDKGLEKNPLFGLAYRLQHGVIEILTIGIELHH